MRSLFFLIILVIYQNNLIADYEESFVLFDGNYNLSQNWESDPGNFFREECKNFKDWTVPSCDINIKINNNTFSFIDFYGSARDCTIYQNHLIANTFSKFIVSCSNSKLYNLVQIEDDFLLEEYGNPRYKLLIEPEPSNKFCNFFRICSSVDSSSPSLQVNESSDISKITEKYSFVKRGLSIFVPELKYFIYSEDILIKDGKKEGVAGGLVAHLVCSQAGIPLDCYSVGSDYFQEMAKEDGSSISQWLCINFDAYSKKGYLTDWKSICQNFKHSSEQDFSKYIPRYFSSPLLKFWDVQYVIE